MVIERRIKLKDKHYYLGIELKYDENKLLNKVDGSHFDMGDLSIMIETFEEELKESDIMLYDDLAWYMNDILYLYDRFPFVSYIKDVVYGQDGNIACYGCINKDEIEEYIKAHNIEMNRWDKKNCTCPLLYEENK